jgi:hypothetical protein
MWARKRGDQGQPDLEVYIARRLRRRLIQQSPISNPIEPSKMKFTTILSSMALVIPSLAQTTPSGFLPAANATLDIYYGTQYISPGLLVKKSCASSPSQTYLAALTPPCSDAKSTHNRPHKHDSEREISPRHDRYLFPSLHLLPPY